MDETLGREFGVPGTQKRLHLSRSGSFSEFSPVAIELSAVRQLICMAMKGTANSGRQLLWYLLKQQVYHSTEQWCSGPEGQGCVKSTAQQEGEDGLEKKHNAYIRKTSSLVREPNRDVEPPLGYDQPLSKILP